MGASASKASRAATPRKYPTSVSTPSRTPTPSPRSRLPSTRSAAITLDAADPTPPTPSLYTQRLRDLGAVQPSSPTGPAPARRNPTLVVLESRARLGREAAEEFEAVAVRGGRRRFVDVGTVRTVVGMVQEGRGEGEIEEVLGLGRGTVGALGRGVVGVATGRGEV